MSEEPPGEPVEAFSAEEAGIIKDLIRRVRAGETDVAQPLVELDSLPRLQRQDLAQDIRLKRTYGKVLLWAMIIQLGIADVVFVAFAQFGAHWDLSARVINVWLGATLVEVIGIVLVVTRYLFPRRGIPE